MRKPTVDYSGFKLSKLRDPKFSHLLLLLGWPGYFVMYFLTENLIPREKCHVIHSFLDDLIPFCEGFVVWYVFWYVLIVISLGYFMFYNVESFKKLQTYIIITQVVAMAVYIIYPSCQNLRPDEFARENVFTFVVNLLYSFDTSTGVCPSLHVAYSIGIASVWLREKGVSKWWKAFVVFAVIMICLSTMFIKQHSAVDFFAAIPVCILAEAIVYGKWWKEKFTHRHVT
ncbi:MAG: phosphatidic acid phosphatase [Clostridia bacterium]|nr:phosphatidic acid phosphatase [Clostridia bacterium]